MADEPRSRVMQGDCRAIDLPDRSVDLVFCSPPYEDSRTYGIDFARAGRSWVMWAFPRYLECLRVSRGLVAWVVNGKTKGFRYSCVAELLMAELHLAGVKLRKPPIYHRWGIPGSGGPDWLRDNYEVIICASRGKLPWSDNTAMGKPPKYTTGGACSNRTREGARIRSDTRTNGSMRQTGRSKYALPALANPGNVITCSVGGGRMGSALAHENEAPFSESLADFFVRSFCPPGGVVLDPFCGSGTVGAAAIKAGRRFVGVDVRESQVVLTRRRLAQASRQAREQSRAI